MAEETRENAPPDHVLPFGRHVSDSKWNEIWAEVLQPKHSQFVFLNPNFARTYYVPTSPFRYEYDDLVEYNYVNNEMLASMKNGRYESIMQRQIRSESSFVSIHVCSPVQLLNKLCLKCSHLMRISLHFYYLDEDFVAFLVGHLPKVVCINLENCIGLSTKACANLGYLNSLAHLNLSGCDVTEESMSKVLDNYCQLESLNISNNCALAGKFVVYYLNAF